MISIWERQSFLSYDYIIVGAGIVGLSTAISLKEKEKSASVLILERGIFPSGASTKNAGFACFGSLSEILNDISLIGEEAAFTLVSNRWEGLLKLRKRLGDKEIDYVATGGYELLWEDELKYLESVEKVNNLLKPIFNQNVYYNRPAFAKKFGFSDKVKTIIYNPFEGQIDSGKMMASLIKMAYSWGITILTGAEVTKVEQSSEGVSLSVSNNLFSNYLQFSTKTVAICTNAFTKKLLPELELNPGRGIVLATGPINGLKFKGAFHFHEGYYYFRNFGNRVIFGGGRNLDITGETSTSFEINQKIAAHLVQLLENIIIPGQSYDVEFIWPGIMAFGKNKIPIVKKLDKHIVVGVRLGGMGVAIGTLVGEKLAEMMLEQTEEATFYG